MKYEMLQDGGMHISSNETLQELFFDDKKMKKKENAKRDGE